MPFGGETHFQTPIFIHNFPLPGLWEDPSNFQGKLYPEFATKNVTFSGLERGVRYRWRLALSPSMM